jgi:hypothetical protein
MSGKEGSVKLTEGMKMPEISGRKPEIQTREISEEQMGIFLFFL